MTVKQLLIILKEVPEDYKIYVLYTDQHGEMAIDEAKGATEYNDDGIVIN